MEKFFELVRRGGWINRERGLLRHEHDTQAVLLSQLAVVQKNGAGEDAEKRRLAGAIAADEPDALALFQRERRAVEERQVAVGELGVGEGEERHLNRDQTPASLPMRDTIITHEERDGSRPSDLSW